MQLEEEHAELRKLVHASQTAASAALQEMAAVELRVMRAIRGESEEADNKDNDDALADFAQAHTLKKCFNLKKKLFSYFVS
jgi:hypothetical protein